MSSMHVCVTMPMTQAGVADQFIKDVKVGTAKVLKNPTKKTTGGVSILLLRCENVTNWNGKSDSSIAVILI